MSFWIIRLLVNKGTKVQDLGTTYAPFISKQASRVRSATSGSIALRVYYAAAYASERFRSFYCPAFGHNKKISSLDIEDSNEEFSLDVNSQLSFSEKPQLVELSPSSFNGGNSLIGEYYLELALYDSKNKVIHSAFTRVPGSVLIRAEETIPIPSCEGVHLERE